MWWGVVATDVAAPFIWAGAAVLVAAVAWILSTATKAGIAEVVKPLIEPLHKSVDQQGQRLSDHLDTEEDQLREINHRLTNIERRQTDQDIIINDLRQR